MELLAFFVTLFVGALADANIAPWINWSGAGTVCAIAVMGSFLLWAIRHPKKKNDSPSD